MVPELLFATPIPSFLQYGVRMLARCPELDIQPLTVVDAIALVE